MQTAIKLPTLGKEPPSSFRIYVWGLNPDTDSELGGGVILSQASAEKVMARFYDYGNSLPINLEHNEQGLVYGYFKLAMKEDGLWADPIVWNELGVEQIKTGQAVYYSPKIQFDLQTQELVGIDNLALTKAPATKHIEPLTKSLLSRGKTMNDEATQTTIHPFKQMLTGLQMSLGCAQSALSSSGGMMTDESKGLLTDGVKMMAEYSTRLMESLEKMGVEKDDSEEMTESKSQEAAEMPATEVTESKKSKTDDSVGTILALTKNLESAQAHIAQQDKREIELLVELGMAQQKISPREKPLYLTLNKSQVEAFLEKRTATDLPPVAVERVELMNTSPTPTVPQKDLDSIAKAFGKFGITINNSRS
jgi:hypothetical protein